MGVVLATQNPMDIDYRVLSNAGIWWIGRLQPTPSAAASSKGLAQNTASSEQSSASLSRAIKPLAPRWFVMRNSRASEEVTPTKPRWTISFLRGPMTPSEIRRVRG